MSQCHDDYVADPLAAAHIPLRVGSLMTVPPITVEPTTTIKEIAHILLQRDIRTVPVVDTGDLLVGVVSEADVICREGTPRRHNLSQFVDQLLKHEHDWYDKADGITAGEIMTTHVITCSPAEPVPVVVRRMLSEDVRMLPVVEAGRLVGVVSRHDIMRVFDRPDSEIRERIASLLDSPLYAPEGNHIRAEVIDGMVHLSGSVRYPSDAQVVVSLVSGLPGVIEVRSELVHEFPEPKPHYLKDTDWR